MFPSNVSINLSSNLPALIRRLSRWRKWKKLNWEEKKGRPESIPDPAKLALNSPQGRWGDITSEGSHHWGAGRETLILLFPAVFWNECMTPPLFGNKQEALYASVTLPVKWGWSMYQEPTSYQTGASKWHGTCFRAANRLVGGMIST